MRIVAIILAAVLIACATTHEPLLNRTKAHEVRCTVTEGQTSRLRSDHRTDAFDHHVQRLCASNDPAEVWTASLLMDVVRSTIHRSTTCTNDPVLTIAIYAAPDRITRAAGDALAAGLTMHGAFSVSRLQDFEAVRTLLRQLHRGSFSDATIPGAGEFRSPHALLRIMNSRDVVNRPTVHTTLTCLRTLTEIAATNHAVPAQQPVHAPPVQPLELQPLDRCEGLATLRAWICCQDPDSPTCRQPPDDAEVPYGALAPDDPLDEMPSGPRRPPPLPTPPKQPTPDEIAQYGSVELEACAPWHTEDPSVILQAFRACLGTHAAAIRKIQEQYGLPRTGVIGPKTEQCLRRIADIMVSARVDARRDRERIERELEWNR